MLVQLREKRPQFDALGVQVVCVVQGTLDEARKFCARHGMTGDCVPDPEKESYRAMGFTRTTWKDILFAAGELKRRRNEAKDLGCGVSLEGTFQKHSDVLQLPGAALVDRSGAILWLHHGTHPADMPSMDELLSIVRGKLGK